MDRQDKRTVLIAGGGVAALEAALALDHLAEGHFDVELLAPEPYFWHAALAVAEPFKLAPVRRFELSKLAASVGATFVPGALTSVDEDACVAHTSPGGPVSYSALLICCGAIPRPTIDGALTFRGPSDTDKIEQVLAEALAGEVRSVTFVVPAGAVWSLPAYELALMTAAWAVSNGLSDFELSLVTPEDEPLQLFGPEPSDAVRRLLDERGVAFHGRSMAAEAEEDMLLLADGRALHADRVIALPRLEGPEIGGVPQTFEGFIPVDSHGRVIGLTSVYAAGDITTFGVKQGGIATQQADAAAETIAAELGCDVTQHPFRPVLRGVLLTGADSRYLYGAAPKSRASVEPLWWPPAKIAGRYLAPFLAGLVDAETTIHTEGESAGIGVEIELEVASWGTARRDRVLLDIFESADGSGSDVSVGDVMFSDPLVVDPEWTLSEVAERMNERELGSALVAQHGRLVGILTTRDMFRAIGDRVRAGEVRARQWMTAEPITISPRASARLAAALLEEHAIHHLPVVDADRLVGMVGLGQILDARARTREPLL